MILSRIACTAVALFALACSSPQVEPPPPAHGTMSALSQVEGDVPMCEHKVPRTVCAQCQPELVADFKKANDWCGEHARPESQCHLCHDDLDFTPLPVLPAGADVQQLSKAGEDVADLGSHAVVGKVTVFDFHADWCAPCRKVDRHVYGMLGKRQDVALRKLNIVSWETPLARRYLANVPSMPLLVVYGRDGKLVRTIAGFDLPALDKAIAEGAAR